MNKRLDGLFAIDIPKDIENMQLPDPVLLSYYKDLQGRRIWLDTELDESWLEYERQILVWNKEDADIPVEQRKPIKLFFFSPGGDLDINNSFIDIVKLSKTPVIGINMGICMSGGAFTFLACHKRYTLPKATFLLHTGSCEGMSGTAEQIAAWTANYNKQIKELKEYLINDIGLDKKLVNTKMRGEWFLDAKYAVELGIAHEIVSDISVLL